MKQINTNLFNELKDRELLKQLTHEEETKQKLAEGKPITLYIGFDPTADSLHVGNLMGLLMLSRFQKAGHKAIVLCGGGTGMIGDPSGKSDLRQVLTVNSINENIALHKKQMEHFIDFKDENGIIVNNADWILDKNYIEFLREVGAHFTVNRMLQAECFKNRMEKGLSFLEFNYMILQAYDFYHLNKEYGCNFQLGGDDQWSNIIAGVELIRRKEQKEAFGVTFPLLLKKDGVKMGKTEKGAVWLNPDKTSPYDFFQFWRNVDDAEVIQVLKYLTFVPMDEIRELEKLEGQDINNAKIKLAHELTTMVHGEEEANKAQAGADKLFSAKGGDDSSIPATTYDMGTLKEGIPILDALIKTELTKSKGEGKRQIKQNGIAVNEKKSVIHF